MRHRFRVQCLLLLLFCSGWSFAQTELRWVARYTSAGSNVDKVSDMAIDTAGNVYVTGTAMGGGNFNYITVKYNNAGVQQWAATYNGTGNGFDEARAIAVDGAGNVYVTGMSEGAGANYDYATVMYNAAGVQQWATRYNGAGNGFDEATAIAVDAAGNSYVTGESTGAGTGSDFTTVKYNNAGAQQWAAPYNSGGTNNDGGKAIVLDAAGNVYVTGKSRPGAGQDYNIRTIKYNNAGTQQWAQAYNGPASGFDAGLAITVDAAGDVYVAGQALGSGAINYDIAVLKYNTAGTLQWSRTYDGPGGATDQANAVVVDAGGHVYVTGRMVGAGTAEDFVTIKYSPAGTLLWTRDYNGPSNNYDEAKRIVLDALANVYVSGYSHNGATNNDYTTIKYDSSGVFQWKVQYDGPASANDQGMAVAVDDTMNVYVSGHSTGSGTNLDYATMKYCQYYSAIQGGSAICTGDTVQLNASGGVSYSWSPAAGLSDPNIANPLAYPTVTTTYVLTASNFINCTDIDSVTIVVNPLPAPTIAPAGPVSLCQGENIILSTDTTMSYLWNTGHTTISITVDTTGMFTVQVTDSNGCVNSSPPVSVTVNPLPVVNAGGDVQICTGDSAQLGASGADTYAWAPASTLNNSAVPNPKAGPADTTTYYVTGTITATGCKNSDSVTVIVNPLPVVSVSSDTSLCPGDSAQLTASGGANYTWTPAAGLSNPNVANPMASPSVTTTYSVTVTDSNACGGGGTVKVTVFPQPSPVITAGGPLMLCLGDSVTLSTGAYSTYLWNTGHTTQSITVDTSGVFTVSVTDANTCPGVSPPENVVVNAPPVAAAFPDTAVCTGQSVQLSGSGAHTFLWTPAAGLDNNTIQNPVATPGTTTTYFLFTTDTVTGCSDADSVTITVNPLPVVTLSNDTAICRGDTAFLLASGGVTYVWTPAAGLSSTTVANPAATPSANTTYRVTVTDANGCSASDSVRVSLYPLPTVTAGGATTFCVGGSVILTASNGVSYIWNTTATTKSIVAITAGTYVVTVNDANGCSNSAQISVTVNPLPVANAGQDVKICYGTATQLNASGGIQYTWSPAGTLSDPNIANPVATPTTTVTVYIVTVTDANGCSSSDTVVVTANTLPSGTAGPGGGMCPGGSVTMNAGGGHIYSWSPPTGLSDPNIANPVASPFSTITYFVTITDTITAGCKTDTVTVTVYPLPVVDAGPDVTIYKGDSIVLNPSGGGAGLIYVWSPMRGLDDSTAASPVAGPTLTTIYSVMVTNQYGCTTSDVITVTVTVRITIPGGISPNGDGKNDTWKLNFVEFYYPDTRVEIYDRWGIQVFSSVGYTQEWDGTYNGAPLPIGTYYYVIDIGDGSAPITGPVVIVR